MQIRITVRIWIKLFTLMWIRILLLIKGMWICEHCHTEPPHLPSWASTSTAPPRLHFEPVKLLNFDFNEDPDPAFHSKADPHPASKDNADQCGSWSAIPLFTLLHLQLYTAASDLSTGSPGSCSYARYIRSAPRFTKLKTAHLPQVCFMRLIL